MALPAIAMFLRGALSAAARSGAVGRGAGGLARIGKTAGEYRSARGALQAVRGQGPTIEHAKKLSEATHALDNFKTSVGVNGPEFVKSLKEWRSNLVESGKSLSMYNGAIAKAYQELGIGDVQRKLKLGRATSGSTAALAESENRRRNTTVNWEALSTNIQNRLATLMNNAMSTVGELLDPIAESLNKLVEIEGPKSDGIIAGLKPLQGLASKHDARTRPGPISMGS